MKYLMFVFTALVAVSAMAHDVDSHFAALMQRHASMVDNSGETFLNAEIQKHEDEAELGEVVQNIAKDMILGLDEMHMYPLKSQTPKQDLVELLTGGYYPFFCVTFEKDMEWTEDNAKCAARLNDLLGDVVERADKVSVIEMSGNYYGVWASTIVVLQNFKTKESLVLEFDLIHEI